MKLKQSTIEKPSKGSNSMNRKETIMAVGVLVIALALIVGVFVLSPSPKDEDKPAASTAEHDETNSDGHHNSDTETITTDAEDLTNQSEVSMDIKDFKYTKANIKIKKGTTVTWTNQDAVEHNVMEEHDNDEAAHDPPTKDKVKPDVLAGQLLAEGESYSFTFNEVGDNPYHCSPHPYMKGSVIVVE